MFVKSLRLQGFKSFADRSALEFTQGISCVVGPNGSGKSNIVDALAWVMGSQAARQMRGGRMEDVIFSGTPNRPALGRAEAILTIDNSEGRLPVDVAEIDVGRVLFRSGDSKYMINGDECRLIDIVELLADAGVGRQMHNLVGQGHIEQIIMAQPEQRRITIEEASGVLKHRKRRERAMRRLEGVEADLVRLEDVHAELMKRLRPLARQVKGAERYETLRAEHRRLAMYVAGSAIRSRRHELETAAERVVALKSELADVRVKRENDAGRLDVLQAGLRNAEAAVAEARERREQADRLVGRFGALAQVLAERRRGLDERLHDHAAGAAADIDIDAERRQIRSALDDLDTEEAVVASRGATYENNVREHSVAMADFDADWHAAGLDGEDRRNALGAQRAATVAALERARSERERLDERLESLDARRTELKDRVESSNSEVQRLDAASAPLADRLSLARAAREHKATEIEERSEAHRRLTSEIASLRARAEALEAAVAEGTGARRARWSLDERYGSVPRVRDLLAVEHGAEHAVAAALGPILNAVMLPTGTVPGAIDTVKGVDDAVLTLAGMTAGDRSAHTPDDSAAADAAARFGVLVLREVVRAADGPHAGSVDALLRRHAGDVLVCRSAHQAVQLSQSDPRFVFVTPDGDRCVDGLVTVRSRDRKHTADPALGAAQATRDADALEAKAGVLGAELDAAHGRLRELDAECESLGQELGELDAQLTACADTMAALEREISDVERQQTSTETQLESAEGEVGERERRLTELDAEIAATQPAPLAETRRELESRRAALERRSDELRTEALEIEAARARLEERRRSLETRLDELDRIETESERRRAAAVDERARISATLERLAEINPLIEAAEVEAQRRRDHAGSALREHEQTRAQAAEQLDALRERLRAHDDRLGELGEARHRAELAESEARLRLEAAEEIPGRDHGVKIEDALDATLPDDLQDDDIDGRLSALEKSLKRIGPINPLAVEEYEALSGRKEELDAELEDVRKAKRDIVKVVHQVDDAIASILSDAYADVARHFADMFALLFPGGEGRVVLTDPGNVLETGVEIEARPRGKSLKRISLLSGGERSLSSLAFLFAVFRARPSPFYVLDEVEAALDDVNLHRFCSLLREFRRDSQIIVVTHQKRTMEIADVLYGVSLDTDGTSSVLGQRMSDLDLTDEAIERATTDSA